MNLKERINIDRLPKHIAIIMDGNGRWAKKHNRPRVFGHQNGVKAVRETTEAAAELGIEYLTLYAFSTENWSRPKLEVNALMSLLVETLRKEISTLQENDIRLKAIGNLNALPKRTNSALKEAIAETQNNQRMTLVLALNYSGRWELSQAVIQAAVDASNGLIEDRDLDTSLLNRYLTTQHIPDPELMIRTSGEYRISNFLLYQIAYTELYFTEVLWPDFRKEHLYEAIIDFQQRERRFGKTSEQLATK